VSLAQRRGVLIGVVHLPALPGAPGYRGSMQPVVDACARDAETLAQAGFDAVLVENFGDAPFFATDVPDETIAAMAVATDAARRASGKPIGVNVLRNDGIAAMSVAVAAGAQFVRINVLVGARVCDQGVVQGDGARIARLRAALHANDIDVIADVGVKHSAPLAAWSLEDEAREAIGRGGASAVIVTGAHTGAPANLDAAVALKHATGSTVWVGSGVRAETLRAWLDGVDGVIVGSALRADGRAGGAIDFEAARRFVAARG